MITYMFEPSYEHYQGELSTCPGTICIDNIDLTENLGVCNSTERPLKRAPCYQVLLVPQCLEIVSNKFSARAASVLSKTIVGNFAPLALWLHTKNARLSKKMSRSIYIVFVPTFVALSGVTSALSPN